MSETGLEDGKSYTADEVREFLSKQKEELAVIETAKLESLIDKRFSELSAKMAPLGDSSAAKSGLRGMRETEDPLGKEANSDGLPKAATSPSYHTESLKYPLQYVAMPHMNPSGSPPKLDEFNYFYWKTSMRSHLRSVCVELWGIVEHGFVAVDERNMSPQDKIDCQLNSTAIDKIRSCLRREVYDQVINIESAKDLWAKLALLHEGTTSIQKSKYEAAKQEMHMFVVKDGESLSNAYARLIALKEKIRSLGGDRIRDGFEVNEEFIKSKFIQIISPKYQQLAFNINFLDNMKDMTADDLIGYFVSHDEMVATAKKNEMIARAINSSSSSSLALKAKVCESDDEEEEEEVEREAPSSSELGEELVAFLGKKFGKFSMKRGGNFSKKRRELATIVTSRVISPTSVRMRRGWIGQDLKKVQDPS